MPSKSDTTRIAAALGFFCRAEEMHFVFGDGDDDADDDADDVREMEDGVLVACRREDDVEANRKEFARKLLARLRPGKQREHQTVDMR